MSEYDSHSGMKVEEAFFDAVVSGATTGNSIDTTGFESCTYAVHVGTAIVGSGGILSIKCQEAPDVAGSPGSWVDVPDDEVIGGAFNAANPALKVLEVIEADANLVLRIGTIGKKEWQRLLVEEDVTVTAGAMGAIAILGHAKSGPVAAQNT